MKQETDQHKDHEKSRPPVAEKGDGTVEPGHIIPPDNSMERRGEGDRTDTDEMHRLNDKESK